MKMRVINKIPVFWRGGTVNICKYLGTRFVYISVRDCFFFIPEGNMKMLCGSFYILVFVLYNVPFYSALENARH